MQTIFFFGDRVVYTFAGHGFYKKLKDFQATLNSLLALQRINFVAYLRLHNALFAALDFCGNCYPLATGSFDVDISAPGSRYVCGS